MPINDDEVWCGDPLEHECPGRVLFAVAELPVDDVLSVVGGEGAEAVEVGSVEHQVAVFFARRFESGTQVPAPIGVAEERGAGGAGFLD